MRPSHREVTPRVALAARLGELVAARLQLVQELHFTVLTPASGHLGPLFQFLLLLWHGLAGVSCFDHLVGRNSTRRKVSLAHHLNPRLAISGA